jgi:DNA-binding response OmpR family regulator
MEKQKKILVVEDEQSIRTAIVDTLQETKKFLPIEAENGKEGVELALSKHPDLILLDLVMPEMDGMTALKKIREDAWGSSVPVIIYTNLSATNEQLVEDMVNNRPAYYLVKSDWKLSDIVDKIEDILKAKN